MVSPPRGVRTGFGSHSQQTATKNQPTKPSQPRPQPLHKPETAAAPRDRPRRRRKPEPIDKAETEGPRFLKGSTGEFQSFDISRRAIVGTPIGRPRVTGLSDNGELVTWTMRHRYRKGVPFQIHPKSGLISVIKRMGRRTLDKYTVKVT